MNTWRMPQGQDILTEQVLNEPAIVRFQLREIITAIWMCQFGVEF